MLETFGVVGCLRTSATCQQRLEFPALLTRRKTYVSNATTFNKDYPLAMLEPYTSHNIDHDIWYVLT